jgi:RNA-splicing ligase RtcB
MSVPAKFFASPLLLDMVVAEAQASSSASGGFVAALQQLSNVATLPGIVGEGGWGRGALEGRKV